MAGLDRLAGLPLGFPKCPQCPYLQTGPSHVCATCAGATFDRIGREACPICSQILDHGHCPNALCRDPHRRIDRIRAIAYLSGDLRHTIHRYKYYHRTGWRVIFGRLLLGWLEESAREAPPELIIANPTFVASSSAGVGHTEAVLDAAAREDVLARWPFDLSSPRILIKTKPTPKSANTTREAKQAAARALRDALEITDPSLTQGRRVLVYDDVCTTGSQLDAVAEILLDRGEAASVEAIVLARAPWRHA